jgi:hypothetical protein
MEFLQEELQKRRNQPMPSILKTNSLAATLDAVGEALFYRRPLPRTDGRAAALWIAGRQGLPGSYFGMFAPTESDIRNGVSTFTGESIKSRAATRHVLSEEACRTLVLLKVAAPAARTALKNASDIMIARLDQCERDNPRSVGRYCCGTCSVSLWRHLAADGLADAERRLAGGLRLLKARRSSNGRWQSFPFHYTLLALSEIDMPAAADEIRYAAPVCERLLRREATGDKFDLRHRDLAERALALC